MKKCYNLKHNDKLEEIEELSEVLEDIGAEGVWLDTGEATILLPPELAEYLEETGILGLA
jgi:uncharacterized protein|tara:strand:+ start:182 stop:361 length:180 start_codon:yes stop_codon:yes gene_type:complete